MGWQIVGFSRIEIFVQTVILNKFIIVILWIGVFEWELALDHNEKNHSKSKYVYFTAIVFLILEDFWSWVDFSTSPSFEFVDVCIDRNSKICYLDIVISIQKNVFWFEIAVNNAFSVHVINGFYNLVEIEPSSWLSHRTSLLTKFDQWTIWHIIKHYIGQILQARPITSYEFAIRAKLNCSIYIGMI